MNYMSSKNSLKNRLPLKLYMHGTHKFVLSCHASYSPPALSFSNSFFSLFSFLSFYSPHLFILHFFLQHKASISSFFLSFFPTPAKKTFQETNFSIQTIPTNNSHKLFNSNNLQLNAMRRASIFTSSILSWTLATAHGSISTATSIAIHHNNKLL